MWGCPCGERKYREKQCESTACNALPWFANAPSQETIFLLGRVWSQTLHAQPGVLATKACVQGTARVLCGSVKRCHAEGKARSCEEATLASSESRKGMFCCMLQSHAAAARCSGASVGHNVMPLPACARPAGLKRARSAGRFAKRARRFLLKSSAHSL